MKMQILKVGTILLILMLFAQSTEVLAQCPMCKMTAESNLAAGGTGGKGLNIGILFMLSLPYLIVGSIGFIWWRRQRKTSAEA